MSSYIIYFSVVLDVMRSLFSHNVFSRSIDAYFTCLSYYHVESAVGSTARQTTARYIMSHRLAV